MHVNASARSSGITTEASGNVLRIASKRRLTCLDSKCIFRSKTVPTSWSIRLLQRGRYRAGSSAKRKSVSHSGIGTNTQASSKTVYSLSGVRIIRHFVVNPFVVFCACQVVKDRSTCSVSFSFVGQNVAGISPTMRSDLDEWDLAFRKQIHKKLARHAKHFACFHGCQQCIVLQNGYR